MSHSCNTSTHESAFSAYSANSLGSLRLRAFDRKGRKESARCSQRRAHRPRHSSLARFLLLAICIAPLKQPVCAQTTATSTAPIQYTVTLADLSAHKVHVTINLAPGASERDLQLPAWNALYQVRDFAQYVNWVRAKDSAGQALAVQKLAVQKIDKSRWRIQGANAGAVVEYEILLDRPGPYDAELNSQHGFFNLGDTLMYPVDSRTAAMQVQFVDVPSGWKFATALAECSSQKTSRSDPPI